MTAVPRPTLPPTPVICGPTAGGKSRLAVDLAHAMQTHRGIACEIVTADAFQVYAGLDIGTAKPTADERAGIPHHLIDVVPEGGGGRSAFTVDDWLTLAEGAIDDCRGRGVLPIVVGGTHLYVKALLDGLFEGPKPDEALRAELNAMDPAARRAELERVDPRAAARIHPNDVRRTVRALEVFRLTGVPISDHQRQWDAPAEGAALKHQLVILDWPAELVNPRINARVRAMVEQGLVEEVRGLIERRAFTPQSREALGYKQLIPTIERASAKGVWPPPGREVDDAVEQIKIETRRFAKNQRTWLRRLSLTPHAIRIDAGSLPSVSWTETVIGRLG